jgi:RNA polymerase sigma factor (sigma-70 family)
LLQQYVRTGSEPAFRELVQRRVDLVYAAALRQLSGDEHRARDVTQEVFVRLARKASSLTNHPSLAGWLYTTTRFIAVNVLRSESRRHHREQEAHAMQEPGAEHRESIGWDTMQPIIDEAMNELSERDRQAVLARFFIRQSYAEIGGQFGISENAAQKNVSRALDRLRDALVRRGVTSTAVGLGLILANQPLIAAPAGLAASASTAALAGGAGGFALFMGINKIVIGITGALAIAGTLGFVIQGRTNARLREEQESLRQQIQAASQLQTENQRLQAAARVATDRINALNADRAELARAREEIAALKARHASSAKGAESAKIRPLEPGLIATDAWINSGLQNPAASYQTGMWAHREADLDTLAKVFTFRPTEKAKLDELFARLPDETKGKLGSPEKMIAVVFARGPTPAGFQVLSETPQDENTIVARVKVQRADGRTSEANITYSRGPDGWQAVVPANEVASQIQKIAGETSPP